MAIDEALLTQAIHDNGPSRVRVYTWAKPTLSIGANTRLPPDAADRCREAGVDVVSRPTGGGAVLHRGDVTYAVVARDPGKGVLGTYRMVADALIAAFAQLGLDAAIAEHSGPAVALACFDQPTGADISIDGRKICGSAQVRRRGWFLQHGSIPVRDVADETSRLLGTPLQGGSTCLEAEGAGSDEAPIQDALRSAFISTFGPYRVRRGLNAAEIERVSRLSTGDLLPNPLVML